MRLPFGRGRLFVEPCFYLRHNVAAARLNGAALVEVRTVAGGGDRQRCALGVDAADFQMGNDGPLARRVGRLDVDALPYEAIGLRLLLHVSTPRTHAPRHARW
jgi:hypothetical protein